MKRLLVAILIGCVVALGGVAAAPSAPTGLAASVNGTTVTFTWAAPAGPLLGYRLEAGTTPGSANLANSLIGTATSFVAQQVPAGTYYVRIRAAAIDGVSDPSNEVVVTVGTSCSAPPNAPLSFASLVQGPAVTFSWTGGGGCAASNYQLRAGSTAGASNLAIANVGPTVTFSAAAPPGTYYLRVVAQNAFGTSAPSNEVVVTIGTTTGGTGTVRVLYVRPADRVFRADFANAIQQAVLSLQSWYRDQLGGRTFALFAQAPEPCTLPRAAAFYAVDSWSKVLADVQGCAPVSPGPGSYTWVLYVDINHACNAPGRLGAGLLGLTMLPRQDMDGLVGDRVVDDCGTEYRLPISRYVGGLGHEMGHAFGLPHPPGCDAGLASCDSAALMWAGYVSYPATYFRTEERQMLLASPFIR